MDSNLESSQINQQFNALVAKQSEQKEQKATYFILSLLFPPFTIYLALFLSLRRKLLFITLPAQLIFYSAITFVFNLIGLVNINPPSTISQLGVEINQKTNSQATILTLATTIFALFGLVLGFYFKNKAKKDGFLSQNSLWLVFILLNILVYGVIFLMISEFSLLSGSLSPAINSGYQGL